ncbi:endoribonuclease [Canna indica]|uniref:Endoribonuclease n=1 Tax=Canna indica TaxID=4628 RepID=A0AAQ3JN20_9LILI|nr:endoribonuclease [Canna indica]
MFDPSTKERLMKKISRLHATFEFCLKELGAWLVVKAAESLSCKDKYLFYWGQSEDGIGENAVKIFIQEAFQVFLSYLPEGRCIGDDLNADVNAGLLTPKVHCLVKSLLEYRDLHNLRCIIFVERVITAIVIQSLFGYIKSLSGLRSKYMAGYNDILHSQSRTEQINIVDAFHRGEVNVIVATQILEEGLDVRDCNLVIRFDLSASLCSFIQSRGRARMKGSDYLLIIRRDDSAALSKVVSFLESGDLMRQESNKRASQPCKSPKNIMLQDEFYRVESTGAMVTLNSSVALIYFYCSKLPSDEYFRPHPRFEFEKESNRCTLYLPKSSPVQIVSAVCEINILKQVVCLEACKKLHEIGALDNNLLPVSGIEVEDDTQQSVVEPYEDEQDDYFPGELVDSWFSFSCLGLYHCYKIILDRHFSYDYSFNDMMLVVKSNLGSDFLSYSFSLGTERGPVSVHLKYVGIIHLNREQVMMAKSFQISIFNLLLNHDYTMLMDALHDPHKNASTSIAYLLLPLAGGKIDWQCVNCYSFDMSMVKDFEHSCTFEGVSCLVQTMKGLVCSCLLQNCVVYTPHNGRLYFVSGILSGINANSTLKLNDGQGLSYKEYYEVRYGATLANQSQSLLAGRHPFKVQNYLHRRSFRENKAFSDAGVELPPELCIIIMSPISANTLYSFSFAPTIMHRIQCLLLAVRLKENQFTNSMQNVAVPVLKVMEAITTKKCQEEFSLESLETLGDSFLKYATGQHLFRTYKNHHEGLLSAKKDKLVSNAALCRLGCRRNLPGFIRNKQFDPKDWLIPGECVDHFQENTVFLSSRNIYISGTRHMKSKVIADSIEALIGAHLIASGEKAALSFLEWLGMEMEFHQETFVERKILSKSEMYINVKDLQLLLNYSFKNTSFLLEALTHGSYQVPHVPGCYQRLEFLGDAVLDFLMTWYLFNKYPGLTPGLLTDLRSASVNNNFYAHAAVKAKLNKHILHHSFELHKQMTVFLEHGLDAGRDPPKVLGDIIESIAGAIYVDSGYNKETVWKSIKPLLEPIVTPDTVERHPVAELEELCSRESYMKAYKKSHHSHEVSVTAEVVAAGTVYSATVTGRNSKIAKKKAAKAVLRDLKSVISGV